MTTTAKPAATEEKAASLPKRTPGKELAAVKEAGPAPEPEAPWWRSHPKIGEALEGIGYGHLAHGAPTTASPGVLVFWTEAERAAHGQPLPSAEPGCWETMADIDAGIRQAWADMEAIHRRYQPPAPEPHARHVALAPVAAAVTEHHEDTGPHPWLDTAERELNPVALELDNDCADVTPAGDAA